MEALKELVFNHSGALVLEESKKRYEVKRGSGTDNELNLAS